MTGTRTLDTVPGLNRHCRRVSVVLLSRIALPVLCSMVASVTLPLAVLTVTMQTPSPVICHDRLGKADERRRRLCMHDSDSFKIEEGKSFRQIEVHRLGFFLLRFFCAVDLFGT